VVPQPLAKIRACGAICHKFAEIRSEGISTSTASTGCGVALRRPFAVNGLPRLFRGTGQRVTPRLQRRPVDGTPAPSTIPRGVTPAGARLSAVRVRG
jgi:hypothetical protein